MEMTSLLQRRLRIAGGLFGLVLGVSLGWLSYVYPFFALRAVPIDTASFNLHSDAVIIAFTITVVGVTLGGYLVARYWESFGFALVMGGLVTAIVQTTAAYFMTKASLANNRDAELIWLGLPLLLIFGIFLSFLGGLVGSAFERLVLAGVLRLFEQRTRLSFLAWVLVLGGAVLLGVVASGGTTKRTETIAGAQALHAALQVAEGETVPDGALPPGFQVSKLALDSLRELGPRLREEYVISLGKYDGFEVVTDAHFQDGFTMRCVSNGAYITRCFPQ
jgi:hypothetical protein